jgi:hypothetical protein
VSRSAFFAGKLIPPGETQSTKDDPERFDSHAGLRKLLGGGSRLLLRTDAEMASGNLAKDAAELVASDARVVGVVVNAIDDALKGGPGLEQPRTVSGIKSLARLLQVAAEARRAIFMVADHGNVRSARFGQARPGGESARYRELKPDGQAAEGEVVFGDGAWRSKTGNRAALLYKETDRFSKGVHAGEHGGASLAEVVAPALVLASGELDEGDDALQQRAVPWPLWWELRVDQPVVATLAPPTPTKAPKRTNQLAIDAVLPPSPPPVVVVPREDSKAVRILRASEIYRGESKVQQEHWDRFVLPLVAALSEQGGRMPAKSLAVRLGAPTARIKTLVAVASEKLNFDQNPVLGEEQGTVVLDELLLEQLFGSGA